MDSPGMEKLVQQLSAGFDLLQDEYLKLYSQHEALERKLATAREQYNKIAKLYGTDQTATPPLSLSSSPGHPREDGFVPRTAAEILEKSLDTESKQSANKIRTAIVAANALKHAVPALPGPGAVKIWSGPAADKPADASSSLMPSIAESPLEQDFTVEGTPSRLGCPFASMAQKKLSSHAASVLSRYNQNGSVGTGSTPESNASRVNGRESLSRRRSRRESMMDPIKAEICGMSDHGTAPSQAEKAMSIKAPSKGPTERQIENADTGVCPIRFLDQHSPEEVATYFEKHKHELPRSHEVCVMRYQSNEEQIKELDAKYGNLVSMIQGLGQKHKVMLPEEPAEGEEERDDAISDEKIRKWASSVSAQAPNAVEVDEDDERQPHFERPVREVRLGESPSRPWGIQVPAKYLDRADAGSDHSSKPAQVSAPALAVPKQSTRGAPQTSTPAPPPKQGEQPAGKCPFDHSAIKGMKRGPPPANPHKPVVIEPQQAPAQSDKESLPQNDTPKEEAKTTTGLPASGATPIVINGPVFIGYSPEDAIRILKESGLRMSQ